VTERWRVGFLDSPEPTLAQRLLRPGYRHCWAAKAICPDIWLWVEWTPERLIFGLASDELVQDAEREAGLVLEVLQPDDAPAPVRPVFALQHCAAVVSHAIGFRPAPWVTPYRLARALSRAGARAIREPAPGGALS
jgi:hypothetical protein